MILPDPTQKDDEPEGVAPFRGKSEDRALRVIMARMFAPRPAGVSYPGLNDDERELLAAARAESAAQSGRASKTRAGLSKSLFIKARDELCQARYFAGEGGRLKKGWKKQLINQMLQIRRRTPGHDDSPIDWRTVERHLPEWGEIDAEKLQRYIENWTPPK